MTWNRRYVVYLSRSWCDFLIKLFYCCLDDKSSDLGKAFDDLKNQWPDTLEEFKPVPENECNEPTQPGHGMYIACQHIKHKSRHS